MMSHWLSCLLGHLVAMSGMVTVMYGSALTVTRHSLSPTEPCVTKLGLAFYMMIVCGGGL